MTTQRETHGATIRSLMPRRPLPAGSWRPLSGACAGISCERARGRPLGGMPKSCSCRSPRPRWPQKPSAAGLPRPRSSASTAAPKPAIWPPRVRRDSARRCWSSSSRWASSTYQAIASGLGRGASPPGGAAPSLSLACMGPQGPSPRISPPHAPQTPQRALSPKRPARGLSPAPAYGSPPSHAPIGLPSSSSAPSAVSARSSARAPAIDEERRST